MDISCDTIVSPKGFRAAGVACGLKESQNKDLAIVVSDVPAETAGVYTTNVIKGHSLSRTMKLVCADTKPRAILINSGNSNACVGEKGGIIADTMAEAAGKELGIDPGLVLTCSTGIIGKVLPVERIVKHMPQLIASLGSDNAAGQDAMSAIMTTDTVPKTCTVRYEENNQTLTVSGMAKGSGMIHPSLATMIGVITTDADLSHAHLKALLKKACAVSFNRVSVDGDTSECDTVLIMANGKSGQKIHEDSPEAKRFYGALETVCLTLAKAIARDGEGATKLVEVVCKGANNQIDAYRVVLSICRSPLCKTAFFGEDPNWGRLITAVGYAGASFDPEHVDIYIGDIAVCIDGAAADFNEAAAKKIMAQDDYTIRIDLHQGDAQDRMWTCDFSYDYVRINGSYRT